ncbi:hypothetical protein SDC9_98555 [bioreactor metagenome]|uniref:Uncharacterized protein n=1 Tax=bioreactor metagenome TaxID=1076179 RepID=A0A645AQD1_9ZZZZ
MGGRECRHLSQMRHDDHLRVLGEPGQPAADLDGHAAADSGVHLVEDEDVAGISDGEHHFQTQPDAGQFAARGDLRQRSGGGAGVRREQQVYMFQPVGTRLRQRL